MKLNWQTVSRILGGILLTLLVWLGKQAAVQLLSIQKDLAAINVQLAEVRKDMLTKDDVRDIVKVELFERGIK